MMYFYFNHLKLEQMAYTLQIASQNCGPDKMGDILQITNANAFSLMLNENFFFY